MLCDRTFLAMILKVRIITEIFSVSTHERTSMRTFRNTKVKRFSVVFIVLQSSQVHFETWIAQRPIVETSFPKLLLEVVTLLELFCLKGSRLMCK